MEVGDPRQAPVVQKLDNAMHWITQLVSVITYPLDSAIQRLNNWVRFLKTRSSVLLVGF